MALLVVGCGIAVPVSAQIDTSAPTQVPFGETAPNVNETANVTETMTTEIPLPTPTTPLSIFSVLGALGILGILIVASRNRR